MVEVVTAVLELLGHAAWPAAILFFLWPLRARLSGDWTLRTMLQSFRKWRFKGPAGIEAEAEMAELQVAQGAGDPVPPALAPAQVGERKPTEPSAPSPGQEEIVAILEEEARMALKEYDETAHKAVLIRANAIIRANAAHEWVYNRIFGSQIAVLERLLSVPLINRGELQEIYQRLVAPSNLTGYDFDIWLRWMLDSRVLSPAADQYQISAYGRAFMSYIDAAKLFKGKVP